MLGESVGSMIVGKVPSYKNTSHEADNAFGPGTWGEAGLEAGLGEHAVEDDGVISA